MYLIGPVDDHDRYAVFGSLTLRLGMEMADLDSRHDDQQEYKWPQHWRAVCKDMPKYFRGRGQGARGVLHVQVISFKGFWASMAVLNPWNQCCMSASAA